MHCISGIKIVIQYFAHMCITFQTVRNQSLSEATSYDTGINSSPLDKMPPFHWQHFQMHFSSFCECKFCILIPVSLKSVPKVPIDNESALVQVITWCQTSNKPLCQPMMATLLMHICTTQPQRVKQWFCRTLIWLNFSACYLVFPTFSHSTTKQVLRS